MTPELWQRVEDVLNRALELNPAERTTWVERECGADIELRRQVESLLQAAEEAGADFLDNAPPEPPLSASNPAPVVHLPPGQRLGPWEIRDEIDRGGMGTVYLAVRADDAFFKRVAVKVLQQGARSGELAARFEEERRILARLEHPNIAHLLDGGATPDALPYLVMEHVEGETIDRFCRERNLGVEERLRLFRQVCSAVGLAHRNLVVHCDLKPGNILVTAEGEPKLLDFGIAQLLSSSASSETGPRAMTPRYASPEQVRGEDLTTATDIYSLGVLLYELLTGVSPYCAEDAIGRSREILHGQPLLASQALKEHPGGREAKPRAGQIRGDLDSILGRALAKEPMERYASVEQFSEDLERHLTGRAVLARRPTFSYLASRFLRRHVLESALAAAVLFLSIGYAVMALSLKEQAEQERDHAEEVTHFLLDLFELPDPRQTRGETVTARQLLDAASRSARQGLEGQPEERTRLIAAIGSAYAGLELHGEAVALLEESLENRQRKPKRLTEQRELVALLLELASVYRKQDKVDKALAFDQETLVFLDRNHLGRHRLDQERLSRFLNNQAGLREFHGDLETAERLYRHALEMKRRLVGPDHHELAVVSGNLAAVLAELGRVEEAEALYRHALDLQLLSHPRESPEVARALNNLAVLLRDAGKLAAAETLLRDSLEIRLHLLGSEHPAVAVVRNNLASLEQKRGRFKEAASAYEEALQTFREALGPGHANVGVVLRNRATLELERGEPEMAEASVRQALEIFRATWPEGHWRVADAQSVLGDCLLEQGQMAAAMPLLKAALVALRAEKGEASRHTVEAAERVKRLSAFDLASV